VVARERVGGVACRGRGRRRRRRGGRRRRPEGDGGGGLIRLVRRLGRHGLELVDPAAVGVLAAAGAQALGAALEQFEKVLEVGDVLRVDTVADDADGEREAADEQTDDRHREGDTQLGGQGLRVTVCQGDERRRQRDEGTHEAEHRPEADEHPRPFKTLDRVELILLQELERLHGEALGLVVPDEVEEEARHDEGVVVLLQVAIGAPRPAFGERLAGAQCADLERLEVTIAEAQVQFVDEPAELDEYPDEADDRGDEHRVEEQLGGVEDRLLQVVRQGGDDRHGPLSLLH